jgi:hypothetical protein
MLVGSLFLSRMRFGGRMKTITVAICIVAALSSRELIAATVTIPAGTRIFGELQESVTSDVKEFDVGDFVTGRVWRNVIVDGQTVIPAGAPMTLQVSAIKKRKTFGRAGSVEIRAMSVTATDGSEIYLDGGYDKKGESRVVLSSTLAALVAWPTLFIKGKEAVLPPGTVFDAAVPANTNVTVPDGQRPTLRLGKVSNLTAEILYDDLTEDAKELPVKATLCEKPMDETFEVTAVNEAPIDPLEIELIETSTQNDCHTFVGRVDLKDLSKHFTKGINRFTVSIAGESTDLILDVEM